MRIPTRPKTKRSALVLAAMVSLVTLLAGCTNENEEPEPEPVDMEAFQEALDAPGPTYTPDDVSGRTDFQVKLLQPADPDNTPMSNRPVVLLVYDGALEEPIVDAEITITETWMPNHNHECIDHRDPGHEGNGIYEGRLHVAMEGRCDVTYAGERTNGDSFVLTIEFFVPG